MEALLALKAVLPAALLAGVILAAAWRIWPLPARPGNQPAPRWTVGWAAAVAVGLGYFAGHVVGDVMPPWPARETTHRLAWMALAGAFALPALCKLPVLVRWPALLAVAVAAPWWLLANFAKNWSGGETAGNLAVLGASTFAVMASLEVLSRRRPGATVPLVVMLTASLASGAIVLGKNATVALYCASLAAVCGAAWVNGLLAREESPSLLGGGAALAGLLVCLLTAAGYHTSSYVPATSALLLALAPLGAWSGELLGRGVKSRLALSLLGVLAPAGVALFLAWQAQPPPSPYGY